MSRSFDLAACPLEGMNLIEASAGTGKTHALTGLYLRLVAERGLRVDQILVVTYTEAATAELRERVRRGLRDALGFVLSGAPGSLDEVSRHLLAGLADRPELEYALRAAVRTFDESGIFTIHGFCRSVLAEHAFESGAPIGAELLLDQTHLEREVTEDFWRLRLPGAPRAWLAVSLRAGRYAAGPDGLTPLLRLRSLDPEHRVIPAGDAPDLDRLAFEIGAIHRELTGIWRMDRDRIEGYLIDFPGWNAARFRPAVRSAACAAAEVYLSGDDPLHASRVILMDLSQERLASRVKKGFTAPQHAFFQVCEGLAAAGRAFEEAAGLYGHILERDYLTYAQGQLEHRRQRRGLWSFDDLLVQTYRALREGPAGARLAARLAERYRAALIDEFQDTDPLQYRIFSRIFRDSGWEPSQDLGAAGLLYLIGDPKQAIYAFRGADVQAYLSAARRADTRQTLSVNRRSSPELVSAINGLFGGHARPFVHDDIGFQPATAYGTGAHDGLRSELVVRYHTGTEKLSKGDALRRFSRDAASAVAELEVAGYAPHQIAVLVRTNRQAQITQEELRAQGLDGVLYVSGSVYASDQASELQRVLQSMLRPGSEAALRSALATSIFGFDAAALADMEGAALDRQVESVRRAADLWRERGFLPAFRWLLETCEARALLLRHPDGERRLTNVLHLAELLHRAESDLALGPEELFAWLRERRSAGETSEEAELRLESDDEAVVISTIHRAKGLEYEAVVCPFLWDGLKVSEGEAVTFHDSDGAPVLDLAGQAQSCQRSLEEQIAEAMRLLYVALTRARTTCHVSWGWVREAETSPLFYLLHCRDFCKGPLDTGIEPAMRARGAEMTSARIEADLRSLEAAGVLRLSGMGSAPAAPPRDEPEAPAGVERVFGRKRWDTWTVTSYSGLTRGRHQEAAARDVDAGAAAAAGEGRAGEGDILAFPRGAAAGSFLHELLESADFGAPQRPEAVARIRDLCARWGHDARWVGPLTRLVGTLGRAPLRAEDRSVRLADLNATDRLTELQFHLPFGPLDPKRLAAAFSAAGGEWSSLAGVVADLGFGQISGYLQGFIDAVVRWEERYYIVDWKSNHLGWTPADYGGRALARSMRENLYNLQLALYTVALDRYLRTRLAGYDAARSLGGAFYVFVRGVRDDWPDCGVVHTHPGPDLVEALERVLREPA